MSTLQNWEKKLMRQGLGLLAPPHTLNSTKWRCAPEWPCKRIATCEYCRKMRRSYFISLGGVFVRSHAIDSFVTIKWPTGSKILIWETLTTEFKRFWRIASRASPKYIRCLAIGESWTPHVHLLISSQNAQAVTRAAKSANPSSVLYVDPIECAESVLGYIFDRNFYHTYIREDRPPRVRILSGSRGMSYGFPTRPIGISS